MDSSIYPYLTTLWYQDDDDDPSTVDSTRVVTPDPVTGDLTFRVMTSHDDVRYMEVQVRKDDDGTVHLGKPGRDAVTLKVL